MELIAHRGASGHAPEHTFAAYDLALAQGADMLELDVRVRADGVLVVQHDPTTRRIGRAPLELDAVLARYGDATRWLVELKDPNPAWELRAVAALDALGLRDRAVFQSFDARAMRRLRVAFGDLSVSPLSRRRLSSRRLDAFARYACSVGVWHGALDVATVAAAHARGLGVRAWTVNDPAAVDRMLAMGVDGVITDVPDVAAVVAAQHAVPALAA